VLYHAHPALIVVLSDWLSGTTSAPVSLAQSSPVTGAADADGISDLAKGVAMLAAVIIKEAGDHPQPSDSDGMLAVATLILFLFVMRAMARLIMRRCK
jgi:hypothetical protein